jgi:hypothetical protein
LYLSTQGLATPLSYFKLRSGSSYFTLSLQDGDRFGWGIGAPLSDNSDDKLPIAITAPSDASSTAAVYLLFIGKIFP